MSYHKLCLMTTNKVLYGKENGFPQSPTTLLNYPLYGLPFTSITTTCPNTKLYHLLHNSRYTNTLKISSTTLSCLLWSLILRNTLIFLTLLIFLLEIYPSPLHLISYNSVGLIALHDFPYTECISFHPPCLNPIVSRVINIECISRFTSAAKKFTATIY